MELQTEGKSLQITSDNLKRKSKSTKCTESKGRQDMHLPKYKT